MAIYGTGPITVRHAKGYQMVNYGGSPYGEIPAEYLAGNKPANYPVPAIRTAIEIFPYRVCIWDKQTNHHDLLVYHRS